MDIKGEEGLYRHMYSSAMPVFPRPVRLPTINCVIRHCVCTLICVHIEVPLEYFPLFKSRHCMY